MDLKDIKAFDVQSIGSIKEQVDLLKRIHDLKTKTEKLLNRKEEK